MSRLRALLFLAALAVIGQTASSLARQSDLSIVSITPTGEIAQLADANDVRVVFSEPMIAIGSASVTGRPSWMRITPEINGHYFWSGTRTLIFSPDPSTPFPYATTYTVHIDAGATSVLGHALSSDETREFTTPTVRLLSTSWYRKNGRFDDPVVLALRFNQPVRPADVLAHVHVRLAPHTWTAPQLDDAMRARMERSDRTGLSKFDAKVAAVDRVVHGTDPLGIRAADSWNEQRFPKAPELTVIETSTPPPPEAWLDVTIDDTMPSPQGPATHPAQSSQQRLDRAFFIDRMSCTSSCDPFGYQSLQTRVQAQATAIAAATIVTDVTKPAAEKRVNPARPVREDVTSSALTDAGYDPQPPMTTWLVRVDGTLLARDGQTLGYPWMGTSQTIHAMAAASVGGGVWESGGGTQLPLSSRNVTNITKWITTVAPGDVMRALQTLQHARGPVMPPVAGAGHVFTVTPDVAEAHGIDVKNYLSRQGTGVVWFGFERTAIIPQTVGANVNVNATRRSSLIQVTNLGITVKDSRVSTLVFVTRLDTAAPVTGARVSIVNNANQELWSGSTNQEGIAMAPALALRPSNSYQLQPTFIVTAEKDGDVAYVGSDWGSGIQPYSQARYQVIDPSPLRGSVFTDRGAYREGEEVRIKAVLRRDDANGTKPLATGAKVFVHVRDSRGQEVDRRTLEINRWSSVDWTWRIPADAALGNYSVQLIDNPSGERGDNIPGTDQASGTFLVAQYRRPDFRVDATLTGDPDVLGTTLHGVVDAKYLFGRALDSRPVRWWVTRTPAMSVPAGVRQTFPDATYAFGYMPPEVTPRRNPRVSEKTETLDGNGHVDIAIPTEATDDFAYRYFIGGDVTSVSEQHIASNAQAIVYPAAIFVGVKRPSMFVDVKDGAKAGIVVSDLAGVAVPGVSVTVSLEREEWAYRPVGGRAGAGNEWQQKTTPAGEWTVRSTADAVPLTMPIKDGGSYVLHARATDASGRRTRTDLSFYAIGGGASPWRMDGNNITIVPEHVTWKPGEKARVMIQSPWPQATALMTVEREGVRRYQQFQVHSTQDVVDVPLTDGDVPNVFVSVLLVKGRTADALAPDGSDAGQPAFRVGYTTLTVDDASKALNVRVASDREEYLPHASATVSVAVSDAAGKPRATEVALWAVDYGLLSLTNYTTPDILNSIYAHRQLLVSTADTRERMISRKAMVTNDPAMIGQGMGGGVAAGRGGGGGAVAQSKMMFDSFEEVSAVGLPGPPPAPMLAAPLPPGAPGFAFRKDFRPVVFWLGSITTGADGRASTNVTLPDSVTTYRIMAVADEAQQFGSGEHEIRVTKPLTLLPAFPRFLSRGDRASFGATLTNDTKTGGDAIVTIRSLDTEALQFEPMMTQTVRLAAGATAHVRFDAIARGLAPVRVQMTVTLGAETDAFETTLPVTMPSRLETVAAYGDTTSSAIEKLILPAGAVPGVGSLSVNLASTALVGLSESAHFVDAYPYEHAEAKASRALVLMLTADLGGAFSLPGVKPEDNKASAAAALDSLYGFQCNDGGFTYWPGACLSTSPYLTAYVIDVWHTGTTLGMTIEQNARNRALDYLQNQLRQPPPEVQFWPAWSASQAYAVKVLAESGRRSTADITRLVGAADRMPVFALSYLADALAANGNRSGDYQDIVRRITNALRVEADRAHVEEMDDDSLCWLWSSNVRATAVVLDGLSRRHDAESLVSPLTRWLLASRTNGRWGTTYENATALSALVSYYHAFESEVPSMTATVKVGSLTMGTTRFEGRSTTSQEFQLAMPDLVKQLGGATRDLAIDRTGTGRLFYTTRLQYLAPEPPDAADRGMHVERRFERVPPGGAPSGQTSAAPSATTFALGDLVRVTVSISLPAEGKFIAIDERMPAGFEAIDESLSTTAFDLAAQATVRNTGGGAFGWWRNGGFDHVEKHDDRVLAFATRLSAGRHEFSYLARATTAGTFTAAGASAEAMYAPEVSGRSSAAVITIK